MHNSTAEDEKQGHTRTEDIDITDMEVAEIVEHQRWIQLISLQTEIKQ